MTAMVTGAGGALGGAIALRLAAGSAFCITGSGIICQKYNRQRNLSRRSLYGSHDPERQTHDQCNDTGHEESGNRRNMPVRIQMAKLEIP